MQQKTASVANSLMALSTDGELGRHLLMSTRLEVQEYLRHSSFYSFYIRLQTDRQKKTNGGHHITSSAEVEKDTHNMSSYALASILQY